MESEDLRPIRRPRRPRKRPRTPNPEVRRRLMVAASELIHEQGVPQLRVEDVAARADLSVGTWASALFRVVNDILFIIPSADARVFFRLGATRVAVGNNLDLLKFPRRRGVGRPGNVGAPGRGRQSSLAACGGAARAATRARCGQRLPDPPARRGAAVRRPRPRSSRRKPACAGCGTRRRLARELHRLCNGRQDGEATMGRVCAWCGTVLHGSAVSDRAVSHALCGGCFEELRASLAATGIQIREPRLFRGTR